MSGGADSSRSPASYPANRSRPRSSRTASTARSTASASPTSAAVSVRSPVKYLPDVPVTTREPSAAFSMRTTYSPPRTGTPRCLCPSRTVSCPPSVTVPAGSRSRPAFAIRYVSRCAARYARAAPAASPAAGAGSRMPSTRAGVCVRCPGTSSPGLGGGAASAAVAAAGTTGTTSAATPISAAAPDMPTLRAPGHPARLAELALDRPTVPPNSEGSSRRRPPPGGAMKPTTRRVINGAGVSTDQFQPRRG